MKVTGYKIREAISRNKLRRDTANSQFTDSLHVFPNEKKRTPDELVAIIEVAEDRIAKLQVLQDRYNLENVVDGGQSLAYVVKRIGGLERQEKMWRSAATQKKDKWASFTRDNPLLRDKESVAASAVVPPEGCAQRAEQLQKQIAGLRELTGVANGRELDFTDLDGSLFE